jgi:hypothetical protein
MIDAREKTSWVSIFGSALALLGLARTEPGLVFLGIALSAASASAALYLKRNPALRRSTGVTIDGLNLDSLSIANLRRRLNRSLTVERAFHVGIINGTDLNIAWQYDGHCRSQAETTIEFSVDTENNVAFDELDCFAFDLQNDPERLHKIRPILVGSDGVSKKISVPFLQPLGFRERFSVLLNCNLPGCITTGVQYYTSSLSFDQGSIESATVHLMFVRTRPEWVKVYECDQHGRPRSAAELRPFRDDGATCEFVDMTQNVPGQSVRVYLYDLAAAPAQDANAEPRQARSR